MAKHKVIYKSLFKNKIIFRFKRTWQTWELRLQVLDREIEFSNARLPLFKAAFYPSFYSWHFVWWKFSFTYALRDGIETVVLCGECDSAEELGSTRHQWGMGDDAYDRLSYCESCQSVEGDTREVTVREHEAMA